ncbi:DUF222 domain-containing protein, partial [Microbacterium sp.]|uniref:DUF222 domain-containing protein n=1 Tax=Microbacterium sp. TaxID=51671 RepID=UPI003C724871
MSDASQPGSSWPVLDDLVSRLLEARTNVAAAQAEEARLLAEAVEVIADRTELLSQRAQQAGSRYRVSDADLPLREVSLELGMAMRSSDRTVQSRISEAHQLIHDFPATFEAFRTGQVDAGHAWGIVRAGTGITDPDLRVRYEHLALAAAETESPARMTQAARAIAATLDPDAFGDRTRRAHDERAVRLYDLPDGMARLIADVPAPLGYALWDRLTAMAHATLTTASGGRVFLFAEEVINGGRIETPGGQTVLAAGSEVYLQDPTREKLYASE